MSDRRVNRRYELSLPLQVRDGKEGLPAEHGGQTRDISTRGVYFLMDEDLAPGTPIDFTLTLPPEITQGMAVLVRAQGRVVRAEKMDDHGTARMGVAAVIEKYEIVRAESAS